MSPSAASSGSKTCAFRSGAPRRSRPSGSVPARDPLVDADLHRVEPTACRERSPTGRLSRWKTRILAFGRQVYLLGDACPGSHRPGGPGRHSRPVRAHESEDRPTICQTSLSSRNHENQPGRTCCWRSCFTTANRIGSSGHSLSNSVLQDLDLTGQLAVDRPILVARINRPGAQLALGNAPSTPKSIKPPCFASFCRSSDQVRTRDGESIF